MNFGVSEETPAVLTMGHLDPGVASPALPAPCGLRHGTGADQVGLDVAS
jgi:hypothetical protein